jgi:hypothetical protein
MKRSVDLIERAYSVLNVKGIEEKSDRYVVRGIATTPTADRAYDEVMPLGAQYKLPLPMLFHHDAKKPIGNVVSATPNKKGIPVEIHIPKVAEAGVLKERIDEAIQSIKYNLVVALSIGFKPLEYEYLDSGGIRFNKWEWLELSLVTIGMNAEGVLTLSAIKSLDAKYLAASGRKGIGTVKKTTPGVSGEHISQTKGHGKMDIKKKLEDLQAERATKAAAMQQILDAAETEDRELDANEQKEYDDLSAEVKDIVKSIDRYEGLSIALGTARPVVSKGATPNEAGTTRAPRIEVKDKELPKGTRFARMVKCLAMAKGVNSEAYAIAKARYADDGALLTVMKANVAGGTTDHATWAGPLVGATSQVYADFAEFLRPQTILGKFGQGGVPSLKAVPFRTRLLGQSTGTGSGWVGEGKPIGVTKGGYTSTSLEPNKVATLSVLTRELVESSSPAADTLVRDDLVKSCRETMDLAFITPGNPGVTNVRPASITNGIAALHASGTDADAVRKDARAMIAAFVTAKNPLTTGVWIMSALTALTISMFQNALGQPEFPEIDPITGGKFMKLPVIVSESVTASIDSGGQYIALVSAEDIYYANEGGFMVDMSREASIEMSDAPTNNVDVPAAAQMTSLFQTDAIAIRVINEVNWARRRSTAVSLLDDVAYVLPT